MEKGAPEVRPISAGTLAVFAAAGLPVGGFVTTLAVYLPNYYTAHIGLSLGIVAIAFTVIRVFDVFLDPVLGAVMSGTTTRYGRYRPWLAASIPVLMIATYACYFPGRDASLVYLTLWLLILYAGYSMCVLSHAAWGSEIVAEYHQRSRVFGWIQAVGVVGATSVLLLPMLVGYLTHTRTASVPVMGWFLLVTVPVTYLITCIFAHEPRPRPKEGAPQFAVKDYLALTLRPDMARSLVATFFTTFGPALTAPLYLFFFQSARGYTPWQTTYLLIIYIVAGLVAPGFWTWIAHRFGKHQTIKIAAVAYTVAQTSLLLLPRAHPAEMCAAMFCVGFVASAFPFVLRAMVADINDEVRLQTGKDCTAPLYALVTSVAKVPSTLAVGVAYPLLQLFGFNTVPGAVNTDYAMFGLQSLYLVPPVACVLLGGFSMFGYRLDEKRHREVRAELEARQGAGHVAAAVESLGGPLEPEAIIAAK